MKVCIKKINHAKRHCIIFGGCRVIEVSGEISPNITRAVLRSAGERVYNEHRTQCSVTRTMTIDQAQYVRVLFIFCVVVLRS
jgi:hypothetical protein